MYYNGVYENEVSAVKRFHSEVWNNKDKKIPHPIFSNRSNNCICNLDIEPAKRDGVIVDPGRIGVDRLAIEVPVYGPESYSKGFLGSIKGSEPGRWGNTAVLQLDAKSDTKAHLRFMKNRWSLLIEFNPSRLWDPDGCGLIPVKNVPLVVEQVIRQVFEYSGEMIPYFAIDQNAERCWENWDPDWKSQVLLTRCDASRDFKIEEERFRIDLYKDIRPRSAKATRITYGQGGFPESWEGVYASKYGQVKFYDKYRKAKKKKVKNLPSKGLHRFEFVAGRNDLEHVHIHSLADLDENRFDTLIRFAWLKSRLFARKAIPGAWIDMILESTGEVNLALQSIGYVVCGEYGIKPPISKPEKDSISKLLIVSGVDRRTAITNIGRKRIQLDLEGGVLEHLEW